MEGAIHAEQGRATIRRYICDQAQTVQGINLDYHQKHLSDQFVDRVLAVSRKLREASDEQPTKT
jgi:hypothetical protein